MQLDLSNATLQEIVHALNLKVITGIAPGAAQAALGELQQAITIAQQPKPPVGSAAALESST